MVLFKFLVFGFVSLYEFAKRSSFTQFQNLGNFLQLAFTSSHLRKNAQRRLLIVQLTLIRHSTELHEEKNMSTLPIQKCMTPMSDSNSLPDKEKV